MVKCSICAKNVGVTFLNKILGTYVKVNKKKKAACFECQKKFNSKEDLVKHMK